MQPRKSENGLTLIEMILTITIALLILGVITLFLIKSFYLNRYILEQGLNISSLQNSLRNFSTNLREARHAENGNYLLESCHPYEISFFADIDDDGSAEKLTYLLDGTQLKLQITEPDLTQNPVAYDTMPSERIIGNGVINGNNSEPIFVYYNTDVNNPIEGSVSPEQVRLVRLRIFADTNITEEPGPALVETLVRPRNIP